MNHDVVRDRLVRLRENTDSIVYAQVQDWLQAMYEFKKESTVSCQPDEREAMAASALTLKNLLYDLHS